MDECNHIAQSSQSIDEFLSYRHQFNTSEVLCDVCTRHRPTRHHPPHPWHHARPHHPPHEPWGPGPGAQALHLFGSGALSARRSAAGPWHAPPLGHRHGHVLVGRRCALRRHHRPSGPAACGWRRMDACWQRRVAHRCPRGRHAGPGLSAVGGPARRAGKRPRPQPVPRPRTGAPRWARCGCCWASTAQCTAPWQRPRA